MRMTTWFGIPESGMADLEVHRPEIGFRLVSLSKRNTMKHMIVRLRNINTLHYDTERMTINARQTKLNFTIFKSAKFRVAKFLRSDGHVQGVHV